MFANSRFSTAFLTTLITAMFLCAVCVSHLPAIQKCPSDSKLRLRTSGRDWSRIRRIFKILAWQFQQSHISIQLSTFRLHTSKRQAGSRMIARGPVLDGTPPSISLRPYVGDVWGCNFPLADADWRVKFAVKAGLGRSSPINCWSHALKPT